jgi:hypothetical protein
VKDYQDHVVATLFGQVTVRLPRFRCGTRGSSETGLDWPSHCRSTPELGRIQAHLSIAAPGDRPDGADGGQALPADAPAGQEAAAEADMFRGRLVAVGDIQALAGWLERRPQLGHDVFARGQPEILGNSVEAGQAIDVVEFLWGSLALFDDDTAAADPATVYQARPFELYAVAEARERILQLLAEAPEGAPLERFLPDPADLPERGARLDLRDPGQRQFLHQPILPRVSVSLADANETRGKV